MRMVLVVLVGALFLGGCGSVDSRSMTCGDWRDGSKGYKTKAATDFAERNINAGDKNDAVDAAREAIDGVCETQDDGEPAGDDFKPHDDALLLIAQLTGDA